MGFYDNYVQLCRAKGISPSAAAVEMGFNKSTVTRWKNGGLPAGENVPIIAKYFDVTIGELFMEVDSITVSHVVKGLKRTILDEIEGMTDEDLSILLYTVRAIKEARE